MQMVSGRHHPDEDPVPAPRSPPRRGGDGVGVVKKSKSGWGRGGGCKKNLNRGGDRVGSGGVTK